MPVNDHMSRPIKLLHIISGLNTGGAEMMLYKLLSAMDRSAFSVEVVSLTDIGSVGNKILSIDVPVRALSMRRGVPNPFAVVKLVKWLRQSRPDVIQTWMYHADLIGGVAAKLTGDIPVAWGIRNSNLDSQGSKHSTIWTANICAKLSRFLPTKIICCSEASRIVHTALGYVETKMIVIPNGFDLAVFKPDLSARSSVRQELRIPEDTLMIGLIARFDPQKDHRNFLEAAARLHARVPDVHFLLCGDGITEDNTELLDWIEEAGLRQRCHLLGHREDVPRLVAALDIASSSSSYGEGFPNVVGEAMSCGVPCVVTDVGDSALIVGDTGKVVPPRDPDALASAWHELISIGENARRQLGDAARARIKYNFSLPVIASRYQKLFLEMSL